ncbi:3876_t:CDS:1 [Funneliformis geosporum]|uniref:3178_t:CDS:1 n=1 Tax=Funneliformis geosporum TaxID=1117311 RepID=A0A9W4X3Y7_9GLOM|nr:3178_t:CDS:1 [Funneliformis geosporum]CAI2194129.1 3876_t:CDS:1 [Funneliformis geosporum]
MSDINVFHMFHLLEPEELSLFCNPIYPLYLTADQILDPLLRMYVSCDTAPHPHNGYTLYQRDFSARKNTPFEVNISWTNQSDEVKSLFKEIARVYKRIHKFFFNNHESSNVEPKSYRPILPKPTPPMDLVEFQDPTHFEYVDPANFEYVGPTNFEYVYPTQFVSGYVGQINFDPGYLDPTQFYVDMEHLDLENSDVNNC